MLFVVFLRIGVFRVYDPLPPLCPDSSDIILYNLLYLVVTPTELALWLSWQPYWHSDLAWLLCNERPCIWCQIFVIVDIYNNTSFTAMEWFFKHGHMQYLYIFMAFVNRKHYNKCKQMKWTCTALTYISTARPFLYYLQYYNIFIYEFIGANLVELCIFYECS